jgi:hypothetical protein
LNREGRYRAVYANIESAQAYREQVDKGMAVVVEQISRGARDQLGDAGAAALGREVIATSLAARLLRNFDRNGARNRRCR